MAAYVHPLTSMRLDMSTDAFRAYITHTKSAATAEKYGQSVFKFLEFLGENGLVVEKVPPGILSLFGEWLTAKKLKPASVATYVAGSKAYLEWHRKHGSNLPVFSKADLPKNHRNSPTSIKPDVLLQYLSMASRQHKEPMRTALLLLPYCGLRGQEHVTLQLTNIKKMPVPAQNDRPATELITFTVKGKGGKIRTVPLIMEGKPILLEYLLRWRRIQPGDYLFPMPGGSHLKARTLRQHVADIAKKIGSKHVKAHALRRTYLTTLHRQGISPAIIARIAGHESMQTTVDHYLEIEKEDIIGATAHVKLVSKGAVADRARQASTDINEFFKLSAPTKLVVPDEKDPIPFDFGDDDEDDDEIGDDE